MSILTVLSIALAVQDNAAPDHLLLPIGAKGSRIVRPGLTDMRTGKQVTMKQFAEAAKGYRYVLIGESHDNFLHHQLQADLISALAEAGRSVSVGFEMFTRPVQSELMEWSGGNQSEDAFIVKSDWKKQWGFDFALYRPIFAAVRKYKLPMVALNVPRDWVRAVGKNGPSGLPEEAKGQVPDLYLDNTDHKKVFEAMLGGHPMGPSMNNMYAGQVLWDEGMADTAIKYMSNYPSENRVMAICAGSGHILYSQGINYRIQRRTGEKTLSVVCVDSDEPRSVANGIGEYVFLSKGANAGK